jgi:hypothetical protein
MRYLTLFTPTQPMSGTPTPEMMADMTKLMETEMKAGNLIETGGLAKRETGGLVVTRSGDKYEVNKTPDTSWMRAGGYAILEATSHEDVAAQAKRFLAVAGEGKSEIIQISTMPAPK